MGGAYPELAPAATPIVQTVRAEEDRFDAVLTAGLPKLEELIDRTVASGATRVSGDEVFRLYDSLGVPLDFAEDLAEQRGLDDRSRGVRPRDGGPARRARAPAQQVQGRTASAEACRTSSDDRSSATTASPTARRTSSTLVDDQLNAGRSARGRRSTGASCSTARPSTSSPAARSRTTGTIVAPNGEPSVTDVTQGS